MNVTLITGASGGIGEAFAKRLASENHNLVLIARSEEKLKSVCQQLTTQYPITAQYIAIDLAKTGSDKVVADEFEHSQSFSRLFKDKTDQSPVTFRESIN